MRQANIQLFTEKEEKFIELLTGTGTKRTTATTLVFLAGTTEASSHEIERRTNLRQSEVSIAMKEMAERGWVRTREVQRENKGRPVKIYALALPVSEILECIWKDKVNDLKKQLTLINRMKEYC